MWVKFVCFPRAVSSNRGMRWLPRMSGAGNASFLWWVWYVRGNRDGRAEFRRVD
jgi:hypothetical protein